MDLSNPSNWDGPEHEGWLSKQGHVVKNWKNRYFRLKGNRVYYFENHSARKAKGVIVLEEHSKIDIGETDGRKYCFVVSLPSDKKKQFILDAPSPQVRDEWIEAFRIAMASTRAIKMSVSSASRPEVLRASNAALSAAAAAAPSSDADNSEGRRVRLLSQPTAVVTTQASGAPSSGGSDESTWQSAAPRAGSVSKPAAASVAQTETSKKAAPAGLFESTEAKILMVFVALLVLRIVWAFASR